MTLSEFLKTEDFSLSDSPMFQELIENIKADKIVDDNHLEQDQQETQP